MRYYFTLGLILWGFTCAQSQADSSLSIHGYLEAYYAFDFNEPANNTRPNVFFNHHRHNEFSLNLALLEVDYQQPHYRGHIGLMVGTYAETNLAAEQELLRNIYEAYAGLKLASGLWLDAGIFSSNIGQESPIAHDNYTLTRSLGAEASPYYLAGLRLSYDPNEQWFLSAVLSNGWQNIRETPDNSHKAISVQVKYSPSKKISFSNSFFIGNEEPDSLGQMRYYNNFYTEFTPNEKLKLYAGIDYGAEEALGEGFDTWFTTALMVYYQFTPKVALAGRFEYYEDRKQVLFFTEPGFGFETTSYSLNLDIKPYKNILFRVEGRVFDARDLIFPDGNVFSNRNSSLTSSLAFRF